jgi:hypothetical protein
MFIAMAAAILTAACSSNDSDEVASQQVPLVINASIDGGNNTRTSLVSSFGRGDKIGVYMDSYRNKPFSTTDGKTFTSSGHLYMSDNSYTVRAYYPYTSDASYFVLTSIPDYCFDILCAEGKAYIFSGAVDLKFRHLLSLLTFNISLGDGWGSSASKTVERIDVSGLLTDGMFTAPDEITECEKGTISFGYTTLGGGITALAIPQTADKMTLTVSYANADYSGEIEIPDGELKANHNYVFNATIDKSAVGLTVTLESDNDGYDIDGWISSDGGDKEASYTD